MNEADLVFAYLAQHGSDVSLGKVADGTGLTVDRVASILDTAFARKPLPAYSVFDRIRREFLTEFRVVIAADRERAKSEMSDTVSAMLQLLALDG